ncbi:MAG: hypothetical protein KF797_06105 [Flavobacteriales bacterium]|nr:hypothetical protein [Flavobacteriales bacterium]
MLAAARLLSYVLHPLLMPLIALWAMLRLDPHVGYFLSPADRLRLLGMVAIMTVVFPVVSVLLLRRAGLVTSLELPRREERIVPYLMTLLYGGMALYLLFRTPLHPIAHALFIGILCAVALSAIITVWWKISAHTVGIGGLVGSLFGLHAVHGLDLFLPIAAAILLSGLLATARLLTSDHAHAQIHAGMALGMLCTFCAMVLPTLR